MKKYILSVLLVIILFFGFSSPLKSRSNINTQVVLILYSTQDEIGMEIFNNTTNVLNSNKISYTFFDISKSYNIPSLRYFSEVIVSTEMTYFLNSEGISNLMQYVNNGGKLVQLLRFYEKDICNIFGIQSYGNLEENANGVKFYSDIIPGISKVELIPEDCPNISAYKYTLSNNVKIIARSFEGVPLAWEYQYGKGKTLFWNTTFLSEKEYRGLIISSITQLLDFSARKVYGLGGIFIDDMPSPSWLVKWEPIKSEYDITDTEYYYRILLSDLIELANKYELKYTTATIFAYNDNTTPPFNLAEWNSTNLNISGEIYNIPEETIKFMKRNNDIFEIGFHGYNHIPFTVSRWGNVSNMYKAISVAKEKWLSIIGTEPTIYVPPMNIVDQVGFDVTMDVFNKVNVFSSLFHESLQDGCDRDFGPEIWNNQITAIPRISSGYGLDSYETFSTFSIIEAYGIWTHFLHPDDVFSNTANFPDYEPDWIRNPLTLPWRGDNTNKNGLYYRFEDSIKQIKEAFPWLKYEKISDINKKITDEYYDTQNIVVTDYYVELFNEIPENFIIELPPYLELEQTNDFTITSNMLYGSKRRITVNVNKGCKIYYRNA